MYKEKTITKIVNKCFERDHNIDSAKTSTEFNCKKRSFLLTHLIIDKIC